MSREAERLHDLAPGQQQHSRVDRVQEKRRNRKRLKSKLLRDWPYASPEIPVRVVLSTAPLDTYLKNPTFRCLLLDVSSFACP